ncbi:MAG: 3-dehydroquinate synthase [Prevotella sp.]|nr:3-dehydroquinate synthase [Prevotella sp.]
MAKNIIFSKNLQQDIALSLSECRHEHIFVIVDKTTEELCWEKVKKYLSLRKATLISIGSGENNKNIKTVNNVWQTLTQNNANRHSCIINLGGGMVTDLGGFAAATFKRGIDYINIPTTLLSMVDAAYGGKTGVNANGLKNEIGTFYPPTFVIIHPQFLETLDTKNMLSGFAEMLKHALLKNEKSWAAHLNFDILNPDLQQLQTLVEDSIKVKERIVRQDPLEEGARKALNFGHTIGHAFEEWALARKKKLMHGHAVAYGIICELYLSHTKKRFPAEKLRQTAQFINDHYGQLHFSCEDYDELIEFMKHDKKNEGKSINFTLLGDIGDVYVNKTASEDEIKEALDFYREGAK